MKNSIIIICVIAFFIIIINFGTEKEEIEDMNVYDELMSQQFVKIGFSNEQAQYSVNIIKKIGINSISAIENYDTNAFG